MRSVVHFSRKQRCKYTLTWIIQCGRPGEPYLCRISGWGSGWDGEGREGGWRRRRKGNRRWREGIVFTGRGWREASEVKPTPFKWGAARRVSSTSLLPHHPLLAWNTFNNLHLFLLLLLFLLPLLFLLLLFFHFAVLLSLSSIYHSSSVATLTASLGPIGLLLSVLSLYSFILLLFLLLNPLLGRKYNLIHSCFLISKCRVFTVVLFLVLVYWSGCAVLINV